MTQSSWTHPLMDGLPRIGAEIERRSHEIITKQLAESNLDESILPIVRRVVHATADFSFAESLRVHPDAVTQAASAIGKRKPIVCDVRMLQMGIKRTGCDVLCAISDPEVIDRAKQLGCTRAAAAMEHLIDAIDGGIVAIGNAPTAIWKLLELVETRGVAPALVVGLPVGFVGAAESKQALLESGLCYVTNIGPRGGTPVAAAAVNALAILTDLNA